MQLSSNTYLPSFSNDDETIMKEDERLKQNDESVLMESRERLKQKRVDLHLTVVQTWRMIEAGKYDLSESTVRRFFSDEVSVPTQHTVDVIDEVYNSATTQDFDSSKARLYYQQCTEQGIAIADLQRNNRELEKQCESLAERLKMYEEAIGFYRRQLDKTADERAKMLDMIMGGK